MKLLLITGSYPPMKCGVGDYTKLLARHLQMLPLVKVAVITHTDVSENGLTQPPDIFPIIKSDNWQSIIKLIRQIRAYRPQLAHVQYPTQGYAKCKKLSILLPFILWCLRVPVVVTWHEPMLIPGKLKTFLLLYILSIPFIRGFIFVRPNYFTMMPGFFCKIMNYKRHAFIKNASAIPARQFSNEQRETIKNKFTSTNKRMVVYFGFAAPNKQLEYLFDIADPSRDHLVLVCDLDTTPYHEQIRQLSETDPWKGRVTITGFLPENDVADILASADAVILPFQQGGGTWNTSIHATQLQGTFLLTTSTETTGYKEDQHTFYAVPSDIGSMRDALNHYIGSRNHKTVQHIPSWNTIASEHLAFYKTCLRIL